MYLLRTGTAIDGNTDRYSTRIYRLYSHYLYSYIFRNNEAYLVGFCQQFHEDVDVVECTGLIVASAIAKQCGKKEESSHYHGSSEHYYWGVEFKIQTEKLISADESSLIEALKELFKLQHQL